MVSLADLTITGYDQYGIPKIEIRKDVYVGPEFYFWLGADAYPEFQEVTRYKYPSVSAAFYEGHSIQEAYTLCCTLGEGMRSP